VSAAPRLHVGRSWGGYPPARHTRVIPLYWRSEAGPLGTPAEPVLPYACGRSYGDSCLNDGGALVDVTGLDRLIAFDQDRGILRCEAGITLAEILDVIVPRGWFLPVVPGTRWVSVGGAIANDIHGKNHHHAGTFGVHVTRFELQRSTGERLLCSEERNPELFRATIGGLGLTGVILWAEIRLVQVPGAAIALERRCFRHLDGFFELAEEDAAYEYTVAWVDCLARGPRLGRGVYFRGDHAPGKVTVSALQKPRIRVPFDAPSGLLNRATLGAFNLLYYYRQSWAPARVTIPYPPYFFPLDAVRDWNRLYGRAGFLQYQCVVPEGPGGGPIRTILEHLSRSRQAPGLAVLKRFGQIPSPGMLSFPRPGITLAVDLPFQGRTTLELLEQLDGIVRESGGAVYPAKDARMSPESFRRFFPDWGRFSELTDPAFSSSLWRRVLAS
jgi:FAD/FMN-containing dehydrogenase